MVKDAMNINLHIERLVLEGLAVESRQSDAIREAVEAELVRLLSENGLSGKLQSGGVFPRLQAQAINLETGNSLPRIGEQIGRSVFGSIGPQAVKK
ncbi:MAG: hypothetical protein ACJ74J_22455 [Blastocatellia bacterium]